MTSGLAAKATGELVDKSPIATGETASPVLRWLLCCVGAHHFALPISDAIETLRVTEIESIAGAPSFVRGLSIIRGQPVPIIDTAILFDERQTQHERVVTVRVGRRVIAFAADVVLGIRAIPSHALEQLPSLFGQVEAISAVANLEDALVFFLHTARVIPEEVLADMVGKQA